MSAKRNGGTDLKRARFTPPACTASAAIARAGRMEARPRMRAVEEEQPDCQVVDLTRRRPPRQPRIWKIMGQGKAKRGWHGL